MAKIGIAHLQCLQCSGTKKHGIWRAQMPTRFASLDRLLGFRFFFRHPKHPKHLHAGPASGFDASYLIGADVQGAKEKGPRKRLNVNT